MKKAVIVELRIRTRVIIDDAGEDEKNFARATHEAVEKVLADPKGYVTADDADVEDDEECPYGTFKDDIEVYYQPDFNHPDVIAAMERGEINSFDVFADKKIAQEAFPNVEILEYKSGQIEDPNFVDDNWEEVED